MLPHADVIAILAELPSHYAEVLNTLQDEKQRRGAAEDKVSAGKRQLDEAAAQLKYSQDTLGYLRDELNKASDDLIENVALRQQVETLTHEAQAHRQDGEQMAASMAVLSTMKATHDQAMSTQSEMLGDMQKQADLAKAQADATWTENTKLKQDLISQTSKKTLLLQADLENARNTLTEALHHGVLSRATITTLQEDMKILQEKADIANSLQTDNAQLKKDFFEASRAAADGSALLDKMSAKLAVAEREITAYKNDANQAWGAAVEHKKKAAQATKDCHDATAQCDQLQTQLTSQQADTDARLQQMKAETDKKGEDLECSELKLSLLMSEEERLISTRDAYRQEASENRDRAAKATVKLNGLVESLSAALFNTRSRNAVDCVEEVKALITKETGFALEATRLKQALGYAEEQVETLKKFRIDSRK